MLNLRHGNNPEDPTQRHVPDPRHDQDDQQGEGDNIPVRVPRFRVVSRPNGPEVITIAESDTTESGEQDTNMELDPSDY